MRTLFLAFSLLGSIALFNPVQASTFNSKIADAALAWLDAAGKKADDATFGFEDQERLNWHYTPRRRAGLMIGDMNEPQKAATRNLMRATLSSPGILKAREIMALEAVLAEIEGSPLSYRNPEGYFVSIFGTPGTPPWGWRLEGHHLSINVTLPLAESVIVTPFFAGTNPAVTPNGKRIQYDEFILALRIARSFNADQMAAADLGVSPGNVVAGPGRGDAFKNPTGLPVSNMSAAQRGLLTQLIAAYVGAARDEISRPYMQLITEQLERTYFAWAGEVSDRGAFYYRIHGPRVLIEFDNTRGGNHIHAVWRDPKNDFGRDVLLEHYKNSPHSHSSFP